MTAERARAATAALSGRPDAALARRARAGDTAAFEELVHRHELRAFRVALRVLGDRGAAEDAAQEAFVRAWRALGSFRADSSFTTWLYRIVDNACLDHRAAARPEVSLMHDTPDAGADPHGVAESHERLRALTADLLRLPPGQRVPLVLRELEGLSYEEIGAVLDVSVPAVKGRIHRARLSLTESARAWR